MKIGIIGATGLIGRTLLSVLEHSSLPIEIVYLSASTKSEGNDRVFRDRHYKIANTSLETVQQVCDVVVLSSDSSVSSTWSTHIQEYATWILDISNAHRDDTTIPLVVPEINGDTLQHYKGIISNPNCSTIQLTKAVYPIQKLFGLHKIIVSTYQSVSGMGQKGLSLFHQEQGQTLDKAPLSKNCTPYIGPIQEHGYCQEEWKMIHETKRILCDDSLLVIPTTVRVPVEISHGESIYVETREEINLERLVKFIQEQPYITYDDTSLRTANAVHTNQVFIGRLRYVDSHSLQFWCIADNLLVGSAWNAYQIIHGLERRII